jgi:Domain of unknown function (DUF4189)
MKNFSYALAIVVAVALAAPVHQALAQGKGGDAPGVGGSGREASPQSAPAPTPTPREEPPAPAPVRWNSVASAIWHARGGRVRVAIGYSGARASAEEARSSAIDACKNAGGSGCKALGAWNSGCLYITTGHTANRAGWASGATSEAALNKCRGDGFTCKEPIGGCVD